jgi:hypothetical protein
LIADENYYPGKTFGQYYPGKNIVGLAQIENWAGLVRAAGRDPNTTQIDKLLYRVRTENLKRHVGYRGQN